MDVNLPPSIKFWLDGPDHDCFFVFGPESGPTERIGAYKLFLKGHSEPMRAMFGTSGIAEKEDVRLVDVEPEAFKNFLKCVYGASDLIIPQLNFEESVKLLYIIEKYLVSEIKSKVVKRLTLLLDPNNIFVALSNPVCLQKDTVKPHVLKLLKSKAATILAKKQVLNLNCKDLMWILQQDMNVKEIKVWNAVLKWGRKQCSNEEDIRSKVFPLLAHIRFLAMESEEFWKEVEPSGILNRDEVYEICKSAGTRIPHSLSHISCNASDRFQCISPDYSEEYSDLDYTDEGEYI